MKLKKLLEIDFFYLLLTQVLSCSVGPHVYDSNASIIGSGTTCYNDTEVTAGN
jgi:hypothetical protein